MVLYPSYRTQPHVKHFTIERYSGLYEYRERIRVLFRVIYMMDSKQNIILLAPFIKRRDDKNKENPIGSCACICCPGH